MFGIILSMQKKLFAHTYYIYKTAKEAKVKLNTNYEASAATDYTVKYGFPKTTRISQNFRKTTFRTGSKSLTFSEISLST